MEEKIDFVIPWVDGNDPEWQAERRQYRPDQENDTVRFRDWETLRFWFRGVEKYAPWVNKIHFVTWGHVPAWLNTENPKLHIVRHEEYIPKEYLPTYSSHTIELNFNKINGLSEEFVYFNDDLFLINPVEKSVFFENGLPCDMGVLFPNHVSPGDHEFDHILLNDAEFFANHFNIKTVIKENRSKWLTLKYGKNLLKTLCLMPFPQFPGFMLTHTAQAYKKSTLNEVWEAAPDLLDATCRHRFRQVSDVNQYVFRYWQLGKGQFAPANIMKRSHYASIGPTQDYGTLFRLETKVLCLNDVDERLDFTAEKNRLIKAFTQRLPDKSAFEK